MEMPPVEFLHECFIADADAGTLTWRKRPMSHFRTKRVCSVWNARYHGTSPSYTNEFGYKKVGLTWAGKSMSLRVHRVLYAMKTGAWPSADIDHKDGNPSDNRASQLRLATDSENMCNTKARRHNALGVKGVHVHCNGRFRAQLSKAGKRYHLGCFATVEQAQQAYQVAARRLHGEFAKW